MRASVRTYYLIFCFRTSAFPFLKFGISTSAFSYHFCLAVKNFFFIPSSHFQQLNLALPLGWRDLYFWTMVLSKHLAYRDLVDSPTVAWNLCNIFVKTILEKWYFSLSLTVIAISRMGSCFFPKFLFGVVRNINIFIMSLFSQWYLLLQLLKVIKGSGICYLVNYFDTISRDWMFITKTSSLFHSKPFTPLIWDLVVYNWLFWYFWTCFSSYITSIWKNVLSVI